MRTHELRRRGLEVLCASKEEILRPVGIFRPCVRRLDALARQHLLGDVKRTNDDAFDPPAFVDDRAVHVVPKALDEHATGPGRQERELSKSLVGLARAVDPIEKIRERLAFDSGQRLADWSAECFRSFSPGSEKTLIGDLEDELLAVQDGNWEWRLQEVSVKPSALVVRIASELRRREAGRNPNEERAGGERFDDIVVGALAGRPSAVASSPARAERRTKGMAASAASPRTARRSPNPSSPGIMTSLRMRSGGQRLIEARARLPSPTASTSQCSPRRRVR